MGIGAAAPQASLMPSMAGPSNGLQPTGANGPNMATTGADPFNPDPTNPGGNTGNPGGTDPTIGGGYGGGGGNSPGGFDQWLGAFNAALPGVQQTLQNSSGQLIGMQGKAANAAQGIDPRFEQYADAQNNLLNTQRTGATNQLNQQMANSGMGNSTAALNQLNTLNNSYNQQQQQLTGQLGLQGLQNSNQAFQAESGLINQQNQTVDQYLQNTLALPAMGIGYTAAQNAGNNSSSGSGKKG